MNNMPYELEKIEQKSIQIILNNLKFLKHQHLSNYHISNDGILHLSQISLAEKIIYTSVCYCKVDENTIKKICLDLNLLLFKKKISYQKIAIQFFHAFNVLFKKSENSLKIFWIIKTLKGLIYDNGLLQNTNYEKAIIDQIVAELVDEIKKLKRQGTILNTLPRCNFVEKSYQNIINNYFELNKKINDLNDDLLLNNVLKKKLQAMRFIYEHVNFLYKSVELLNNLNLANKNIFLFYKEIIKDPTDLNQDDIIQIKFDQNCNYQGIQIQQNCISMKDGFIDEFLLNNAVVQGDDVQGLVMYNPYISDPYEQYNFTFKNEIYLEQQKKYVLEVYGKLFNCNSNSSYVTSARNKIIIFNKYYYQCKIILNINKLNFQLTKQKAKLLSSNYTCLHKYSYNYLAKEYEVLLSSLTFLIEPKNNIILEKVNKLIDNYQIIDNIYQVRSNQFFLLNAKQQNFVNVYFKYNPHINKLSKKTNQLNLDEQSPEIIKLLRKYENILPLTYSLIRDPLTNKLFVILPGKETYIVFRNGSISMIEGLIGKGAYGKVKLAQALDDFSIIIVKIQKTTDMNFITKNDINNEEKIQKLLNQFIASSMVYNYNSLKYYTFSKYINGKNVYNYLCENADLNIEEILMIIIKILYKVKFLHNTMRVIHGDLSFYNMLYDPVSQELEIIDFGFSGIADKNDTIPFPNITFKHKTYIANECYTYRKATFASDIYTLGCWFKLCVNINQLYQDKDQELSSTVLLKCFNLIDKMLNVDYKLRPNINECIDETLTILDDFKNLSKQKYKLL